MPTRFSKLLSESLNRKAISAYRLAKLMGVNEQYLYKIVRGDRRPSDELLLKLSQCPGLGFDIIALQGWRALDDYSIESILVAVRLAVSERLIDID